MHFPGCLVCSGLSPSALRLCLTSNGTERLGSSLWDTQLLGSKSRSWDSSSRLFPLVPSVSQEHLGKLHLWLTAGVLTLWDFAS